MHKFLGKRGEDILLWSTRTEATLAAEEVMGVVATNVVGDATEALSAQQV